MKIRITCILSGILTAIPLMFPHLALLGWFALIPAVLVLIKTDVLIDKCKRRFYSYGFCFFYAYYLCIFHWFIYLYPLEFTGMPKLAAAAVVIVAWLGVPLIQASLSSLLFPLFASLRKHSKLIINHFWLSPVAISALWIIFEWAQTQTWIGVPWARLAIGQYCYLPIIQSASLLGAYLTSFIMVLVNSYLALALIKITLHQISSIIAYVSVALSIFCLNYIYGIVAININSTNNIGNKVTVAAIQGNINSSDKWSISKDQETLNIYKKLSLDASKDGAQLIVFPETAIPYTINQSYDISTSYFKDLGLSDPMPSNDNMPFKKYALDLAQDTNAIILLGAFYKEPYPVNESTIPDPSTLSFNAILNVSPEGFIATQPYYKRHLVPFGEYLPMRKIISFLIPPLANLNMFEDELSEGNSSNLHNTIYGKIGSLICFDSIYEWLARSSVSDGAELLTISTNDSWFMDSAAIYQHNAHAVLRAVETSRYIVRAANTGISSIISPIGEIKQQLGPLKRGYIIDDVYMSSTITPYVLLGNVLVIMSAVSLLFLFFNTLKSTATTAIHKFLSTSTTVIHKFSLLFHKLFKPKR